MRVLLAWAWGEVRRHPGRAGLALLGVVLGVASMVAIGISTRAAREAYREMYESLTGRATLEVVAEGLGGFDEGVAARVQGREGVRAALPAVVTPAALVSPGPRAPVMVLGVDPSRDREARDLEVVEGRGLGAEEGVVLLASFARAQGASVGSTVRLLTPTGPAALPVVGLASARALAAFPGGVVLMPLPTAQRLFAMPGRVNAVQVVPAEGASEAEVEASVRAVLPAGLRVQRPAARGLLAESSLRSAEQGLAAVSLMSLVAAVFVILNAFSMNLAERRRDLATVRALGATRRQVAAALVSEAAVLGVVGTLAGVGAGVLGARALAVGIGQMLGVALPAPRPSWGPVLLALVVGPLTALGATVLPARRAAARDPLRDLLGTPETSSETVRRATGWIGGGLVAVTLAAAAGLARGLLSAALIAPAIAAAMLGAALAFPSVLPALRRGVVAALSPLAGSAGRLGLRQVERRPVHTVLSSTVLFLAVMGGVGIGNEILGGVDDVRDWARRVLTEDFFVRATMPESGTLSAAALPEALGDEIAAVPSVAHVNRIRFIPAVSGRLPVLVIAHTFEEGAPVALDVRETEGGVPPRELRAGEAVVGTALAQHLHLSPGADLEVATRSGPARLRVIATATEYTAGGYAVYVSWETAVRAFGSHGADAFMARAKPGRRGEAGAALAALCARDGLLLQSQADLHGAVDGMVDGVVGLMWTALAVVFVVASLGVVNTLTTNVLDQTRQIGVLRAVGMTRRQVRRMVVAQALAIAAMGLLPGALAGVGLSRLMNAAVAPVRGFPIEFRLSWGLVVGCVGTALAVAAAAAAVPAWRAARLEVTRALHDE